MNQEREIPSIIKEVGFDFPFDFENDPRKIWVLELPVIILPTARLAWHLELPFWSSENGFYDLSPRELLANPKRSAFHYQKVINADLNLPIDFTFYKERDKIIDGLHRLTRATLLGFQDVKARFLPLDMVLEIVRPR